MQSIEQPLPSASSAVAIVGFQSEPAIRSGTAAPPARAKQAASLAQLARSGQLRYEILPALGGGTGPDLVIGGLITNTGSVSFTFGADADEGILLAARLYSIPSNGTVPDRKTPAAAEFRGRLERSGLRPGETCGFEIRVPRALLSAGRHIAVIGPAIGGAFGLEDLGQAPLRLIVDHDPASPASRGAPATLPELLGHETAAALLRASPAFDAAWYRQHYPDVAAAGMDPVEHYLSHGAAEGRDPSPGFSTLAYLQSRPEAALTGLNPLIHHLLYGAPAERDALAAEKARLEQSLIDIGIKLDAERQMNTGARATEQELSEIEARLRECLAALDAEAELRTELEARLAEAEAALEREPRAGTAAEPAVDRTPAPDTEQMPPQPSQERPVRLSTVNIEPRPRRMTSSEGARV